MDYFKDILQANKYNNLYYRKTFRHEKEYMRVIINDDVRFLINDLRRFCPKSRVIDYYLNGLIHNRYGPASIQYSHNGDVLVEIYSIYGKEKSYQKWKEYVKVSTRYSRR